MSEVVSNNDISKEIIQLSRDISRLDDKYDNLTALICELKDESEEYTLAVLRSVNEVQKNVSFCAFGIIAVQVLLFFLSRGWSVTKINNLEASINKLSKQLAELEENQKATSAGFDILYLANKKMINTLERNILIFILLLAALQIILFLMG